jgi:predicted RNA-binding protein YlqC (UPF0109 family)
MIKELIEHIVKSLVEHPLSVSVLSTMKNESVLFEITVDPSDRGKVIGKEGQTIKALRSFIGLIVEPGKKIIVDIVADQ